jgi:hypothetical protein
MDRKKSDATLLRILTVFVGIVLTGILFSCERDNKTNQEEIIHGGSGGGGVMTCCGCLFKSGKRTHIVPSEYLTSDWEWIYDKSPACEIYCESAIATVGKEETGGGVKKLGNANGAFGTTVPNRGDDECVQALEEIGLMDYPELESAKNGCSGITAAKCCGCLFESDKQVSVGPSEWQPGPCQSCWTFCRHVQLVTSKEENGDGIKQAYDIFADTDEECLQQLEVKGLFAYPELAYCFESEPDPPSKWEGIDLDCEVVVGNDAYPDDLCSGYRYENDIR